MIASRRPLLLLFLLFTLGCHSSSDDASIPSRSRIAPLLGFEDAERLLRHSEPPSPSRLGADPYRVVALPDGRLVGLLRGANRLVLLDEHLREIAGVPGPPRASGLALASDSVVVASGELSPKLSLYEVRGDSFVARGAIEVAGASGIVAVAAGRGRIFAVDALRDRLYSFELELTAEPVLREETDLSICRGPFDISLDDDLLRIPCLIDHELTLMPVDEHGRTKPPVQIAHDGPIWSSDAVRDGDGFLVALGGVEDRPLDRTIGSFGYVDSFVFVYTWSPGSRPKRVAAIDVSEHGVVTPKVVHIAKTAPLQIEVFGYGGEARATLVFRQGANQPPQIIRRAFVPGSASAAALPKGGLVIANPLLDAWISVSEENAMTRQKVLLAPTDIEARLGEVLFFTELMAKIPRADGPRSRFSCETCHFEGGVDGRTHHTGRGSVRATTKPLFGLLENRPYFSRALDPTMAKMVDNEFRVANAGGGADPWFTLDVADHPFLRELGVREDHIEPLALRRALMRFLSTFEHSPNPNAIGRTQFSPEEARGARVFRDRCEHCHAARRFSDEPETRLPPSAWENAVFEGRLVWASAEYAQTGVEPYVHERGARVPSLRRLLRKRPYFTNGSAATLDEVLREFRYDDKAIWHAASQAPASARSLPADDLRPLLAFLEIL